MPGKPLNDEQKAIIDVLWFDPNATIRSMREATKASKDSIHDYTKSKGYGPHIYVQTGKIHVNSRWSDELVERARKLFIDDGFSAADVARILGMGVTKGAVTGIADRRGWKKLRRQPESQAGNSSNRVQGFRGDNHPTKEIPKLPEKLPFAEAFKPLPGSTPRPWEECGPGMCNWPIDVPQEGVWYCCEPVVGRKWCAEHYATGTDFSRPSTLKSLSRMARRAA